MLRICDQTSIVQQPLEINEKCVEIQALIIIYMNSLRIDGISEQILSNGIRFHGASEMIAQG